MPFRSESGTDRQTETLLYMYRSNEIKTKPTYRAFNGTCRMARRCHKSDKPRAQIFIEDWKAQHEDDSEKDDSEDDESEDDDSEFDLFAEELQVQWIDC